MIYDAEDRQGVEVSVAAGRLKVRLPPQSLDVAKMMDVSASAYARTYLRIMFGSSLEAALCFREDRDF
jgi:hypothetical protein